MTTVLLGSASVHTTATACDVLAERLGSADTVHVVGVLEPGTAERDVGDALNVARTRLPVPTVETATRAGDPTAELRAVADALDPALVVVGDRRGDPEAATGDPPGRTARALQAARERPVQVLVLPPLE